MNDRLAAAGCRVHGTGCSIPWGYDEAHTDQHHPYTPEQLAGREECPHRYAYPTVEDYLEGWRLWRVYRNENRLNPAEAAVRWAVIEERIISALPPHITAAALRPYLASPPAAQLPSAEHGTG